MAKQSSAELTVEHLSSLDRVVFGARILGLCWLGAAIAVLIPIAHFVLVPAGLVAGVVMFMRNYGFKQRLKAGSVPCPKCATVLPVGQGPFEWPKHETCPQCGIDILLKKS